MILDVPRYNHALSSNWILFYNIVFNDVTCLLNTVIGLDQFVGGVSLLPTIIMLLEYGLAIASSTYCLTFFFFDHTVAQVSSDISFSFVCYQSYKMLRCSLVWQNVVLLVHFFSGLILMVISFIMGLIPSTISANSFLKVQRIIIVRFYKHGFHALTQANVFPKR
jgi:hypothetical protein